MSKVAFGVKLGGLTFKVTGDVEAAEHSAVEDMTVQVIFEDSTEQVLVDLPDEFLDNLYVRATNAIFFTLREEFEDRLITFATENPDDPT